jgi:hypothetical protein
MFYRLVDLNSDAQSLLLRRKTFRGRKLFINDVDLNSEAQSLLLRRKTFRGRKD